MNQVTLVSGNHQVTGFIPSTLAIQGRHVLYSSRVWVVDVVYAREDRDKVAWSLKVEKIVD